MRTATKLSVILAVMLLGAVPALAQTPQVTFQVDLNPALDACSFLPESETAFVRGSFDDWGSGQALSDDDNDGVYSTTIEIPAETEVSYKFYVGKTDGSGDGILGWEDGDNRMYTVTADAEQALDVADFNKPISDLCSAEQEDVEITFQVDMQVAILQGTFDPDADVVTVAGGAINGWSTTADTLQQDFINPNIYSKTIQIEGLVVPSDVAYKFVIGQPEDSAPDGWEGGDDRIVSVTGDETDEDNNGFIDLNNLGADGQAPYYNRVGPDQILTEEANVAFEVDLRPAFYYLEDNGQLPLDTQTGEVTEFDGLYINGPVAAAIDGLDANGGWATWGPDDLGSIATRALEDADGDSVFTLTTTFPAGTSKRLVGKFGPGGFDNEAAAGCDHVFSIVEGEQILEIVFGAIIAEDGDVYDDCGPSGTSNERVGDYDPYILIDNSTIPPAVEAVRSGGEADGTNTAVEPVDGELPTAVSLGQNYPNPFNPSTSFEYRIDRAQHVTVQVFDLLGRNVATLVDGVQAANTYRVTFDASNLPSGVYLYQLEAGNQVVTKTMTLLK